ncbi:putative T7SS-secreted protein [Kitasatospora setae]|uniref:putative T7SS-secreted protein n=1 Tax=Kitasatospora setae TaxID=2066 RepID=UPI0005265B47|nr:ADP-ribosyltransferase [Kitasatospora setae]
MGVLDGIGSFVGSVVDAGTDLVGGTLDAIGLDDWGHAVEKWGDGIADDLGAAVGERNLGETDDPAELVHGDLKKLGENIGHLRKFAAAFESTGEGLARMDSAHWQGKAADAFRSRFGDHPPKWSVTGRACADAANALAGLAGTVEWAQGQARQAIDLYKRAQQATEESKDQYKRQVDSYNQAVHAYNSAVQHGESPAQPAKPGDFADAGADGRAEAARTLLEARRRRDEAANTAEAAIRAATQAAPKKAGFWQSLGNDLADAPQIAAVSAEHLVVGAGKGAADLLKFARGVNPMDPYNLSHPAQFMDHMNQVTTGLARTAMHPTELLGALVGTGWGSDPSEAGGKLLFNILSGLGTGGAETAAVAAERVGVGAAENVLKSEVVHAGESAATGAGRRVASGAAEWKPEPQPFTIPPERVPFEVRKPFYETPPATAADPVAAVPREPAGFAPHEPGAGAPQPQPRVHEPVSDAPQPQVHEPVGGSDPFGTRVHDGGQPAAPEPAPVQHEPAPVREEPVQQQQHEPAQHESAQLEGAQHEGAQHEGAQHDAADGGSADGGSADGGASHDGGGASHDGGGASHDGGGASHDGGGADAVAEPAPVQRPSSPYTMRSFEDVQAENLLRDEMRAAEKELSQGAVTFKDGNELSDTMIRDFGAQWRDDVRNFTPEQESAVQAYTHGETDAINGSLRGLQPDSPQIAERVRQLDQAIAAHPVPQDVMVARGMDLKHLDFNDPQDLVGRVVKEDGYMSTSPGDKVPAAFDGKEALVHMRVPAGTEGLWVGDVGVFSDAERELLLQRGLNWRIDKVVKVDGKVHIYGEVIP